MSRKRKTKSSPTNGRSQSWDMDGQGNFDTVTTDGTPESRTHNAQNQLTQVGSSTLTFDANGNMTTDEVGRRFRYDAWNRLISGDSPNIGFAYDALNRRIQEIRPGETRDLFYSTDWQLLEEQVEEVAVVHYVWSPVYVDALVLRDGADSGDPQPVLYALQDANFNVTGIVSSAGVVLERYVQDPYGAVTVLTPTWLPQSGTQFGWNNYHQGLRFVTDVGLHYNRRRDYSPTLMRFVQQDPMGFTAGIVNLYLYLANTPSNLVDPDGLKPCCGPDVTVWFFNEVKIHRDFWHFRFPRDPKLDPLWRVPAQLRIAWMIGYLRSIPYKWMDFNVEGCPVGDGCKDTVGLCGTCIHKSELGNIMYGAMAKLVLKVERLIVGGATARGGTSDVASMAGIVGGLVVAQDIIPNTVGLAEFCGALARDYTNYVKAMIDNFKDIFQSDSTQLQLLRQLGNNALSDMGRRYTTCARCRTPLGKLGASDLTIIKDPGDLQNFSHKDVYKSLPITWPKELR